MFGSGEFETIKQELNSRQKQRQQKLVKIWGILLVFSIVLIVIFIMLFPNQFDDTDTAWILPTYGGMAFIITLMGTVISKSYRSIKPYYEFVYEEVIRKINMNEGLFLEYRPYVKDEKEFNNDGGLFTRFSNITVYRMISGVTENEIPFKVYDCVMTTSNGKSQQTHFVGVYYVLEKNGNTIVQVRSNGSPKQKGVKYEKFDEYAPLKVFKEEDQTINSVDQQYIQFVQKLEENPLYKRVYLSIVQNQIHLAIWFNTHPTKKRKGGLTIDYLNYLEQYFMSELQLINELDTIDSF